MYKTDEVSNKLKFLTNTLRDTSNSLKSLDYLVSSPVNDSQMHTNYFPVNNENKSNSFYKIEQSLENISAKQNQIEDEVKRISNSQKEDSYLKYSQPPLNEKSASTNFLDKIESFTEATFSVNQKLQEAQEKLRTERISLENRNSSFNKTISISPDLKSALKTENVNLPKPTSQSDQNQIESLTKRIIKSESDNSSLKFECDSMKRQYLNEIGSKNSLLSNIENSKSKIYDLEEQIVFLKKELGRINIENDVNRKKAETNARWQEKFTAIQLENDQLKKDSRHCNHQTEIEELRRQKEKAERSKPSMKDQLSDMTKQMDSKQTHLSKLMDELRDLQEKLSISKEKFQDLDEKFHESTNELRHRQKLYEDAIKKIEHLEHSIIELEVNKNNGFSIRDDENERLESQCSRYKMELDKSNIHIHENSQLMNDLHKENESLRTQITTIHAQTDSLRREMEALIKARSIQDEILKRREEDNVKYQIQIKDLNSQVENIEKIGEKYKFDAEIYNQELTDAREKVAVQEERITTLYNSNASLQDQLEFYKADISNLTRKSIGLENQIAILNKDLIECRNREENIDILRRQLEESRNSKEKMSCDIEKQSKKFELNKQNQMKKLEQMLEAERSALKVVLTKCDRQVLEINRLHQDYWSREQLVQKFRKKYVKIKEDFENLVKQKEIEKSLQENIFNEEIREQERETIVVKEKLSDFIEERDQTMRWIILDIDGIVELFSQIDVFSLESDQLKASSYLLKNSTIDLKYCPPTSSALSALGGLDMTKCLLDLKSKMSWLRSEINRLILYMENYRNNNMDLQQEISNANEHIKILEDEKQSFKNIEIEEARKCIAKLHIKEKNETNLQLKCDRLQEELRNVRKYLNGNLVDSSYFDY